MKDILCKRNEKILSLQALRGLAFLGIFFIHTRAPVSWAALGVSTFFVLSGCLLYYRNGKQELPCSLKANMLFARKKMKKLYPLTNRFTVFLGNISPYTFLIHFVIVQYFTTIKGLFRMELSYWENLFFIAVQFVLTILATVIYRNFKIVIDKQRNMIV